MTISMRNEKVFIAGHRGMVGSAILRSLNKQGYSDILVSDRTNLDLVDQKAVHDFFQAKRPEQVYLAAARVGGIHANNTFPAEFIYQNLMIEANIIHEAWVAGVKRLLFLGSSCIYPKMASQPIAEDALLTGLLEPTNEPYAIAKIAGIKLCESYNRQYNTDFRSVMPTNLYGPGDNYHPENSHVIPALIHRFHEAKIAGAEKVIVWGSGNPRREFLYVDDLAEACVHVMALDRTVYRSHTRSMLSHINVGFGNDLSIKELAEKVCQVIGYEGAIEFDSMKPDGTPQKLLDVSLLNSFGWHSKVRLEDGLKSAYNDYLNRIE